MDNIPWVDKYRPRRIDSIIHQDEVKKVLKETVKTGELPNLLFYGPPGSGKTSAILALGYVLFGPNLMNERRAAMIARSTALFAINFIVWLRVSSS